MHTFSQAAARRAVAESADGRYGVLLQHGSLELGLYAPTGADPQEPHLQDEIYVVLSGHGRFRVGSASREFGPGDALFVPAGKLHRFEDFSDDFAAWVIFYGPQGGEQPDGLPARAAQAGQEQDGD